MDLGKDVTTSLDHTTPLGTPIPRPRTVTHTTLPPRNAPTTPTTTFPAARRTCSYTGPICDLHGAGSKLKWRLTKAKAVGPNGIMRPIREYYRVCDVGMNEKKLFQPNLPQSWARKTGKTPEEDSMKTPCNLVNSNVLCTPTVGQTGEDDASNQGWN